jgi:hypothetical protein
MANVNTSDIKNARESFSTDPITAGIGGAAAGHVVAHMALAACGAACLPFVAAGAGLAVLIAAARKDSK